jgi:hypothetical protein
MLRFIPLTALALIIAVGCDQQPVEPLAPETEPETALFSAQSATVTTFPISGTTDLCGYDMVDYEGEVRVLTRYAVDETGTKRSHLVEHTSYRVQGIGQTTGEQWRSSYKQQYAANYIGEPVFDLEGDARTFDLTQREHWIGHGQTPDFKGYFHGHVTINGAGELVLFRVDYDWDVCP